MVLGYYGARLIARRNLADQGKGAALI
jgi:hypothetical protein